MSEVIDLITPPSSPIRGIQQINNTIIPMYATMTTLQQTDRNQNHTSHNTQRRFNTSTDISRHMLYANSITGTPQITQTEKRGTISNGSFTSKLACCNVTSWKNTPEKTLLLCKELLQYELSAEQMEKVEHKLKCAAHAKYQRQHIQHQTKQQSGTTPSTYARPVVKVSSIDLGYNSFCDICPNAIDCDDAEFKELRDIMQDDNKVPVTPNKRNPKYPLKRKQCTYMMNTTTEYNFGQYNETFRENTKWPKIVQKALKHAKQYATDLYKDAHNCDASMYNGVHVTYYKNPYVGLQEHADKESSMVAGMPIFSFTFLNDPSLPRPFSVYNKNDKKSIHDIPLHHGEMLVMRGEMQKHFKHGIKTLSLKKYRNLMQTHLNHGIKKISHEQYNKLERINLTVRAFRKEA